MCNEKTACECKADYKQAKERKNEYVAWNYWVTDSMLSLETPKIMWYVGIIGDIVQFE